MLCLDGDDETGNHAWDAPHTSRGIHGRRYCVRASVSMLASYYGGELSQDRLSYEVFKGGRPEGALGHETGVSYGQVDTIVNWALGADVPRRKGKPTFQEIKDWIDAGRPIGSTIPGHMRVIDGYWEITHSGAPTSEFIHILDPWDRAKWVEYSGDDIEAVWVGPAGTGGAPDVRLDEDVDSNGNPDTKDDSDVDGICDFDERNRFKGSLHDLDPNNPDSDDDEVPDKLDMREYVFNDDGSYRHRRADFDFDGDRKETDPDNDRPWNQGASDGCEDANNNGRYEPNLGTS